MVREERVELSTFGSEGGPTIKPMCHEPLSANSIPDFNPDLRHLFWFLFWLEGDFIPRSIRRFKGCQDAANACESTRSKPHR